MKLPTETLLSQIASKNKGYFMIINENKVAKCFLPFTKMYLGTQVFYTYGGKVWDAETNELLYTKEEGVLF